jgi:tetratricopeptide (TPR) repeat protein
MNKKAKLSNRKSADKATRETTPALIEQKQTLTIQQAIGLAAQHHKKGELPEAESIYQQVLNADPNQPVALHLLGVIAHQAGKNDIAIDFITKALLNKPDYAEAHNKLGIVLKVLGKREEAVVSYNKALTIKSDFAEAHANLGNIFQELGKFDEAVASYKNAIAIKPDFAETHYNLGTTLQELRKYHEAVTSYHKALAIKPDFAEVHSNMGIALKDQGKLEEAVESYNKAITIKPGYAEAHNNLGIALNDHGKIEEAVESYNKAITIRPSYAEAHNNLKTALKALIFTQTGEGYTGQVIEKKYNGEAHASINAALQQFYLDGFRPHEADKSFEQVITALPAIADEAIPINANAHQHAPVAQLPDKVVALLHFGRSGSGLLHSLIDGHPEITTLPSVYLRGYFNEGVWGKISVDGWRGLPARFVDEFSVLFDAHSSKPIPSRLGEPSTSIGDKEGMTSVGENRDQSLSLDKEAFCNAALSLMEGMESIDPMSFLMVVHAAFEKVIGAHGSLASNKRLCFYHIHNPDDYAMANFIRYAPDAQLLITVREPIQNCESWLRPSIEKNNYAESIFNILALLFGIDRVPFRIRGSVGVRLEDIKARPEATMKALCAWLKVETAPTLYEMTAQGEKWWGDPSSPDYNKNGAMAPFEDTMTKRPIGKIFGEIDQFVLGTLFYPFSVRFGYREPEPEQFKRDLKEIRPLIDDMLDFEKVMAECLNTDHEQFKRQGSYQLFRAGLIDRWNVLDELGDYPHMLTPLSI